MTDHRTKLKDLLKELFQFDSADLDFGFYAVMNRKRDQIANFIEHDLLDAVQEGLKILAAEGQEKARVALEEAKQAVIDSIGQKAFDGDKLKSNFAETNVGEKYLQAKAALDNAEVSADIEAQIFNDLYQFFARYYQDGDFISQRRYGRSDKYAIPYNGEEVHLHWANFDQYYVKSGTHFSNYSFTVPGGIGLEEGASVQVRITKVDVERDNVKGDKRFFIFADDQEVIWEEEEQTLTIPFEYRPLTPNENKRVGKGNTQDKLLAEAHDDIIEAVPNKTLQAQLTSPDIERKSDKDRLAYHLNRYAAENTRDFFVHKDLGGFLRRELDYFLKNEVIRLDDVDLDNVIDMRRAGTRAKTIRIIGNKIIAFMEQLEAFQRRLFLKRKFVLQSDYCLTLDKIPSNVRATFYPEILTNSRQIEEWERLYHLRINSETDLSEFPYLMLDTVLFSPEFKKRLLAHFSDLQSETSGLLIHGENFQALKLLSKRYLGKVDCVYIDPPYNTDATPIIYKNNYKDSSWLCLLHNRFEAQLPLMNPSSGVGSIAIDDVELSNLCHLIRQSFPSFELQKVIVNHYPGSGTGRSNVTRTHEYNLFIIPNEVDSLRGKVVGSGTRTRGFRRSGTGENNYRAGRPNSFFAVLVDPDTLKIVGFEPPPDGHDYPTEDTKNGMIRVYPIGENGAERVWSLSYEGALDALEKDLLRCTENYVIQRIYVDEDRRSLLKSVWLDSKFNATTYGTNMLTNLFGKSGLFSYPKSIHTVKTAIDGVVYGKFNALILDYFAGSGTTAHAVMGLNREQGSNHKYVLVEMGEHFDTVLKPRIQKVAFSSKWKDGKPVPPKGQKEIVGQSHMFQYIRLESYDDTFHNIRFKDEAGPQASLISEMPDYMLSYFLEHETAGSPTLLDVSQFERPFEYQILVTGQGGVLSPQPVDLVATFNYLLGLAVQTIQHFDRNDQPYVRVIGTNPEGQRVCVVWRNVPAPDQMDAEKTWLHDEVLTDVEYDKLYLNGDSTLDGALSTEEEFKRRMFEGVQ